MRLPRRLSVLLAGGAAAALVAGCSADAVAPQAAPSPTPTPPPAAEVLRAAAAATQLQGSARYLLSTSTKVNGTDAVLSGDGTYDWRVDKGRTTYQIPVGKVEQRLLGAELFYILPQQGGAFFRVPTAEVAATPLGGTIDPTAQLHALAAVTEAEHVGEETVRGVPTTHYRGTYDVAEAVARAQGLTRDALRSSLGAASGVQEATYDVFLDEDGLLRRLTQTVEVPASPQTNGQALTVTTTLELYDFGLKVVVPGPQADLIRDGAPLLAALRAALLTTPVPPPTVPPAAVPTPPAGAPSVPAAPAAG